MRMCTVATTPPFDADAMKVVAAVLTASNCRETVSLFANYTSSKVGFNGIKPWKPLWIWHWRGWVGCTAGRGVGLHSREGGGAAQKGGGWGCTAGRRWGCTAGRVGGAAQQGGWAGLHSREGGWGCTAGRLCGRGFSSPFQMAFSSPQIASSPLHALLSPDSFLYSHLFPLFHFLICRL